MNDAETMKALSSSFARNKYVQTVCTRLRMRLGPHAPYLSPRQQTHRRDPLHWTGWGMCQDYTGEAASRRLISAWSLVWNCVHVCISISTTPTMLLISHHAFYFPLPIISTHLLPRSPSVTFLHHSFLTCFLPPFLPTLTPPSIPSWGWSWWGPDAYKTTPRKWSFGLLTDPEEQTWCTHNVMTIASFSGPNVALTGICIISVVAVHLIKCMLQ